MEAARSEGRELYGAAKKLAEERQWQEAVSAYEQAQTQLGPEDGLVELLNDWAGALLQLKRDEEALSKYEQALRVEPDNGRARRGIEQVRERRAAREAAPLPAEAAAPSESERGDAQPAGPEQSQTPEAQRAPSASERRAVLRAFADVPLEDDAADALGFRAYADALAGLIDNLGTGTPLTLAINAPWGAGKSTLAKMIERRLRAKSAPGDGRPHAICSFNAWMHDDAPNVGTALAAEVARAANRERTFFRRLINPLPRALWSTFERTLFWLTIVIAIVSVTALLLAYFPPMRALVALFVGSEAPQGMPESDVKSIVGVAGTLLTVLAAWGKHLLSFGKTVADFVQRPDQIANLGNVNEVRKQLGTIIQQARRGGTRRLVVFVDDVERCSPPRAVELLEVVNQLLDHPGVITVVTADMPAVAASADIKYKDLAARYQPAQAAIATPDASGSYGRSYMQKIVQLQFDLPPHSPESLLAALDGLSAEPLGAAAPATTNATLELVRRAAALSRAAARGPALVLRHWINVLRDVSLAKGGAGLVLDLLCGAVPVASAAVTHWLMRGEALLSHVAAVSLVYVVASLALLPIEEYSKGWLERRSRSRLRDEIDQAIQHAAGLPEEHLARSARHFGIPASEVRAILTERLVLRAMNDEQTLADAFAEVTEHLARYPRTIKRFLNQVRLLVAVAVERGMLGPDTPLQPRHLARWIALRERWPALAQLLAHEPSRVDELERAAPSSGELGALLERWRIQLPAHELSAFLSSGSVRLGACAYQIVYLSPEPPSAPRSQTREREGSRAA